MTIMSMDANIVRSVSLRDKLRTFRPELQNPEAVLAERRDGRLFGTKYEAPEAEARFMPRAHKAQAESSSLVLGFGLCMTTRGPPSPPGVYALTAAPSFALLNNDA